MIVITLPAPRRLASSDDMMFASSSLVRARKMSASAMFSSSIRSLSEALPCSTTVLSRVSERCRQRAALISMIFTW
ncbi:hypothetical protein D3C73_1418460 [compost metagenome]